MSAKDGIFKVVARQALIAAVTALPLAARAAPAAVPLQVAAKTVEPAAKITTPAQRCAALEKQFDEAVRKDGEGHNVAAARKLRAEGGHLCEVGQHAAGALRLSHALAEIGLEAEEP